MLWHDCRRCSHMSRAAADLGTSVSWGFCVTLWTARRPQDCLGAWVPLCWGLPGPFFIVLSYSRVTGTQVLHRAWSCMYDLHAREGGLEIFMKCWWQRGSVRRQRRGDSTRVAQVSVGCTCRHTRTCWPREPSMLVYLLTQQQRFARGAWCGGGVGVVAHPGSSRSGEGRTL